MRQLYRMLITIPLFVLVLAACSGTIAAPVPSEPAVDEARATAIATQAFDGFNAGDYETWSAAWSTTMKDAIKESDFLAFRDQVLAAKGRFVAIRGAEVGSRNPGAYRWTFSVEFERGTASFAFGFKGDGSKVEGVFYE